MKIFDNLKEFTKNHPEEVEKVIKRAVREDAGYNAYSYVLDNNYKIDQLELWMGFSLDNFEDFDEAELKKMHNLMKEIKMNQDYIYKLLKQHLLDIEQD